MIIKFFKEQQPLVFIVLPIVMLLIWLFSGFNYMSVTSDNGMPLYSFFVHLVKGWPSFLLALFGFVLVGLQSLYFNWIVNKYEILNKQTYLPALIYFVFSAFLPQFVIFHPMLFVNTLLLMVFDKILRLYKNDMPLALVFDIGFLIGITSLFYFPAFIFCILFFMSLIILKPFSWRDWIIGIAGLLMPYFFTFVIYFLWNNPSGFIKMLTHSPLPDRIEIKNLLPEGYRLTILVISVLFIAALLRVRSNFYKNDIKTRNYHQVTVVFMFTSIACALLTRENMLYKLSIIIVPLSIIVTNYLLYLRKNWWAELLFLTLLATMIFNHVISY